MTHTHSDHHPSPKKVFVIENDDLILDYLKTVLENFRYEVIAFHHGELALKKIVEESPDLILLDIALPDKDGLSICKELKSSPKTSKIPVIMLTCISDSQTMRHAHESGANDFIAKPFTQSTLMSKIKKVLEPN